MEVSVRRRITLALTAVSVSAVLAGGAGIALAASAKPTTVLKCKLYLTTTPPAGSSQVAQPASSGRQYGPVQCNSGFGSGVAADKFTIPISGDFVGTYTQYFPSGSIQGKFDLAPEEAPPVSGTNFTSEAFKGKVTVTGGTGTLKGAKSTKPGVMTCTSPDTVHMSCKETVKVIP
jgi:hypothetical protein